MSRTVKQFAIHQIRLGKSKKNGEVNIISPGKEFDCPEDELDFLQSAGACRDPEPMGEKSPDLVPIDPEGARQALIAQAKNLKIKGIRKNMSKEAIQAKIDDIVGSVDTAEKVQFPVMKDDDKNKKNIL